MDEILAWSVSRSYVHLFHRLGLALSQTYNNAYSVFKEHCSTASSFFRYIIVVSSFQLQEACQIFQFILIHCNKIFKSTMAADRKYKEEDLWFEDIRLKNEGPLSVYN